MIDLHKIERQQRFKRLEEYFKKSKKDIAKHNLDLYFSDHFIDRIIDRNLDADINYIRQIVEYFMIYVYYGSEQNNRRYLLQLKNLKVGVTIYSKDTRFVTQHRTCVVKTVFNSDEEWECDETLELQANYKK